MAEEKRGRGRQRSAEVGRGRHIQAEAGRGRQRQAEANTTEAGRGQRLAEVGKGR